MLDTMSNEDRLTTHLLQVLSHFGNSRRIRKPVPSDTMDPVQAAGDLHLGVDERVQDYSSVLVDDAGLADDTCAVTLVHFAVDRDEEREMFSLTEN